ncbi:winged helix-turn-helix domain-containing protein [Haloferax sp. DFSO60]|uniref:winged helix-turn-helix domain-containing protein n=1 Tax=Haloferax sp. DFSO60 TaxID=3388652 RepID=UPI0039784AD2
MRVPLADWMTPTDRAILERLRNEGNDELVLTPALIAENTDYARTTIREHLATLLEHELVEYHDEERAIYRLSERGRGYLAGEIDGEELEKSD